MLAVAMLAFGALVWGIFLLGRESFGWPVGRAGRVHRSRPASRSCPGRARLRGHPVPGAGGRRARCSRRAGRAAGAPVLVLLALAGLLRPEAWLLAARLLALPAAGDCRGARGRSRGSRWSRAAPLLWALSDLAVTGDALHSLTFTRDTAETLGRPQGIENVPGGDAAAARRDPALGAARGRHRRASSWRCASRASGRSARGAGGARRARVRARSGSPACRCSGATCSCPRRCCAIFFGFAALGWIGRSPREPVARVGGRRRGAAGRVRGLDRLPPDRPPRRPARRHPAARRDPGRPARPDARRRAEARSSAASPSYVPNHRPSRSSPGTSTASPRTSSRRSSSRRAAACTSRPADRASWRRSSCSTRATRSGSTSRASRRASGPWPPTSRGCSTSAARRRDSNGPCTRLRERAPRRVSRDRGSGQAVPRRMEKTA